MQVLRAFLRLMVTGRPRAEIAAELGIATGTVGKRLTPLHEALSTPATPSAWDCWSATSPEQHKP